MKTSGIIPRKPSTELFIIAGIIPVSSLMAVGANRVNTPILQIISSRMKGTILNKIDGIEMKYFWSCLGANA